MPNRDIDDEMNVATLPKQNTVMIKLSYHRYTLFLVRLFWTTLSSKSLNLKKTAQRKQLDKFPGGLYISRKRFCEKKRKLGARKVPHTFATNSFLHQFLYRLDTSLTAKQRASTASHRPESGVAHIPPPSPAEPESHTPEHGAYQPQPPADSTWIISRVCCLLV